LAEVVAVSGDYTQGCVIRQRADLCSVSLSCSAKKNMLNKDGRDLSQKCQHLINSAKRV